MTLIKNNAIEVVHTMYEKKLVSKGFTMLRARFLIKERAEIHRRLYGANDTLIDFTDRTPDHDRLDEINTLIFGE